MAAYTASVTGNWADTATWGGSGPPVSGDSVTINTGITVTVPASTTAECGTSPDNLTTYDLVISGTGQLIVNGSLTVKSNFDVTGGGVVTIGEDGTLNIDSSVRPVTKSYRWRLGNTGTGKLVMGPGAHVTSPSGASWYMESTNPTANSGQLDVNGTEAKFAKFTRMQNAADADRRAWYIRGTISAAGVFDLNCLLLTECSNFYLSFTGSWTMTANRVVFVSSNTTADGSFIHTEANVRKNFTNCVFDKDPGVGGAIGANGTNTSFSECYIPNFTNSGSASYTDIHGFNFKDQLTTATGPAMFQPANAGTVKDRCFLFKEPYNNPHWGDVDSSARVMTIKGMIYECDNNTNNGDRLKPNPSTSAGRVYASDCLFLPSTGGGDGGSWISQLGTAEVGNIGIEHCTGYIGNDDGSPTPVTIGCYFGETNNSPTGRCEYIRRNSARDAPTQEATAAAFLVALESFQTSNDPVVAAACTYNKCDAANHSSVATVFDATNGTATQSAPPSTGWVFSAVDIIDVNRRATSAAAWFGTRIGASGDSTTTPGTAGTRANLRLLIKACKDGTFTGTDADKVCELLYAWVVRGHVDRSLDARGACDDSLSFGQWGAWLPTLSSASATSSTGSVTTNIADGTLYWVVTTSSTAPDWDRVLAGKDHTGATVAAGLSGNQAVSSTGAQSISLAGATLTPATNYYLHVVHKGAGTEAALDDYLRTSETVSSAAFQAAAGGGNRFPAAFVRKLRVRRAA